MLLTFAMSIGMTCNKASCNHIHSIMNRSYPKGFMQKIQNMKSTKCAQVL